MFRIGTREVEARTTNVPKLPNGFQLCKQYIQAHVLGCQVVRNDLEYHGFQVRQAREPRPAKLHQRVRYQPGLGIETVPVDGIATGELDLPDTFQRSEERRGGKECDSTCSSRWWREH